MNEQNKDILPNIFELKTPIFKRLIFQDIAYVDDDRETSLGLAKRHGIKYFKSTGVMHHPDKAKACIVFATIKHNERDKWHDVFSDLLSINSENKDYNETCDFLFNTFEDSIINK